MLEMLIDKFIKMRIVEPISVVNWVFCEDMKSEFHRYLLLNIYGLILNFSLWVWGVLNVSIYRLDCHATNMEQELVQLRKQAERQGKFGEGDDMEVNPEEELELREGEVAALQEDIRNLLLLVCHVSNLDF